VVWGLARKAIDDDRQKMNIVPTALRDTTVAKLSGPRIDRFGFSFQVPWDTVVVDHPGNQVAAIGFKSGASMMVFDPAAAIDSAQIMRGNTAHDRSLMNRIVGAKGLSSNYDLLSAAVQSTPNDVEWWASRAHNAGAFILLENKDMELVEVNSIHPVAAGAMRGFQFGDPDTAPYVVQLKLFDGFDRQYWITISGLHVHRAVITQSEINGLIASLQPVSGPLVNRSSHNGF
jgi:hypothetical protein